jgi:hypothetical protein
MSSGPARRDLMMFITSMELTWRRECPTCCPNSFARYWAKWCVWALMVLTTGFRGAQFLCIFKSPYSLGGLEPCGRSCWMTSSGSDDFLSRRVVFRSVASLGHSATRLPSVLFRTVLGPCQVLISSYRSHTAELPATALRQLRRNILQE